VFCFTCQAHGDVIDFVAQMEGISKGRALKKLSDRTGIPLDGHPVSRTQRQYDREEHEYCLWWQRRQVQLLQRQLTVYCQYATEEECGALGVILRQVRATKGQELKALVARVGNREEWLMDKQNAEDVTWLCVEAMCLA
jgi:hypothetical protein